MITVHGLAASPGTQPVLHDVDLDVRPGRVLGLVGPNGSGKTTLLRCLSGELRPTAGSIALDGEPLDRIRHRELARRIAVVAQDPVTAVAMAVADSVLLGRSVYRNSLQAYRRDDYCIASEALDVVGARHLARRDISSLSGGERQRVLVARALAQRTDHLLLDEPTNHLDVRHQFEVLGALRTLRAATVVVLHDLGLAASYCDDIVVLHDGRVAAAGPAAEVLVPTVLEPVYGVRVAVHQTEGRRHLLLGPAGRAAPGDGDRAAGS